MRSLAKLHHDFVLAKRLRFVNFQIEYNPVVQSVTQLDVTNLPTFCRTSKSWYCASASPTSFVFIATRQFSSKNTEDVTKSNRELSVKNDEQTAVSTSVAETIKETTKTASYSLVVIAGIAITISVAGVLYSELFSSQSPQSIYSKAFNHVTSDERVLNLFGDRIKGFGEPTSRGRRRHVSHVEYMKDDKKYLRMKFYIKGSRASGSVNLEMVEDDRGRYQYRYLFVISDGLDRKSIIIEDNRNQYDNSSLQIPGEGLQELVLSD